MLKGSTLFCDSCKIQAHKKIDTWFFICFCYCWCSLNVRRVCTHRKSCQFGKQHLDKYMWSGFEGLISLKLPFPGILGSTVGPWGMALWSAEYTHSLRPRNVHVGWKDAVAPLLGVCFLEGTWLQQQPGGAFASRPIAFSPSCVSSWWDSWVCTNQRRGWQDHVRQQGADAWGSGQQGISLCTGSASRSSCVHKGGWGRTCLARQ